MPNTAPEITGVTTTLGASPDAKMAFGPTLVALSLLLTSTASATPRQLDDDLQWGGDHRNSQWGNTHGDRRASPPPSPRPPPFNSSEFWHKMAHDVAITTIGPAVVNGVRNLPNAAANAASTFVGGATNTEDRLEGWAASRSPCSRSSAT